MVSLFRGSRTEPALPPQTVRVLVLGDASAGKTALSELIVTRKASRTPKSTAGCSVSVALWDAEDGGDASSGGGAALWDAAGGVARAPQTFFVEIWDVSANPYYEQVRAQAPSAPALRPQRRGSTRSRARRSLTAAAPRHHGPRMSTQLRRSLYKQINGVILVYDATDKSALRRLAKWASEVASDGTFVAPFPDDTAARCGPGPGPGPGPRWRWVRRVARLSGRLPRAALAPGAAQSWKLPT
jgi:GTPase SAR1 family protein